MDKISQGKFYPNKFISQYMHEYICIYICVAKLSNKQTNKHKTISAIYSIL